jgi:hypothetical protein
VVQVEARLYLALPDGRAETCAINYLFHQVGHVTEHKLLGHNISLRP